MPSDQANGSDPLSHTARELRELREDTAALRDELDGLQKANERLASLLSGQKQLIRNLLDRIAEERSEEALGSGSQVVEAGTLEPLPTPLAPAKKAA